jgi:hypothetical protein
MEDAATARTGSQCPELSNCEVSNCKQNRDGIAKTVLAGNGTKNTVAFATEMPNNEVSD